MLLARLMLLGVTHGIQRSIHNLQIRGRNEQDYFAGILRKCGDSKNLSEVKQVHARIVESEHSQNTYLNNLTVQMYGKCGSLKDARMAFDRMIQPNMFSFNIMITAYAQHGGHLHEAKNLFERMPQWSVVTCSAILQAHVQCGHVDGAKRFFDAMPERNVVTWNTVLAAYAQHGHLKEAKRMFDKMPQWDVVSSTAMSQAYAQAGHIDEANNMFELVPESNIVTANALVTSYAQNGHLEQAKVMFDNMFERNVVSWNAMIQSFVEVGHLEEARGVFSLMPQCNVISWTAMLTGYCQNGQLEDAKSIFDTMPECNVVSRTVMLQAYAQYGDLVAARNVFDQMPECSVVSWNAMIAAYAQSGHVEGAKSLFDKMPIRDIVSWTTMIASHASAGHGKDAVELFRKMELEGLKPDEVSLMSILSACSHVGLLDEGLRYFQSMKADYGLAPSKEHYCSVVDILGRAGQLQKAEDLINDMPFPPDAVVWGSLLGACRIHRDAERGERAAKHVFELDPDDAAPFTLLENLYAADGRHEEVAALRKSMKDKGVKKQLGMSIIKIQGQVHKFIVGDSSHSQTAAIRAELQRLNLLMREEGHVPDTKQVLHAVSEGEKECLLNHHSEKMAIAFGLINTTAGTPIQVLNNLRVCHDCHAAIKFVSKIMKRRITVRDVSRFHHFQNGMCSCQDYW